MTELDEKQFKHLLELKGLKLDRKGIDAALQGARNLKAEVACVAAYLASHTVKKP